MATITRNNVSDTTNVSDSAGANDAPRILKNTKLGKSSLFTPAGVENKPAMALGYFLAKYWWVGAIGGSVLTLALANKFLG